MHHACVHCGRDEGTDRQGWVYSATIGRTTLTQFRWSSGGDKTCLWGGRADGRWLPKFMTQCAWPHGPPPPKWTASWLASHPQQWVGISRGVQFGQMYCAHWQQVLWHRFQRRDAIFTARPADDMATGQHMRKLQREGKQREDYPRTDEGEDEDGTQAGPVYGRRDLDDPEDMDVDLCLR